MIIYEGTVRGRDGEIPTNRGGSEEGRLLGRNEKVCGGDVTVGRSPSVRTCAGVMDDGWG